MAVLCAPEGRTVLAAAPLSVEWPREEDPGRFRRRFKVGIASNGTRRQTVTRRVVHGGRRVRRRGNRIDGDPAWQTAGAIGRRGGAAVRSLAVAGGALMDCLHARMAAQRRRGRGFADGGRSLLVRSATLHKSPAPGPDAGRGAPFSANSPPIDRAPY